MPYRKRSAHKKTLNGKTFEVKETNALYKGGEKTPPPPSPAAPKSLKDKDVSRPDDNTQLDTEFKQDIKAKIEKLHAIANSENKTTEKENIVPKVETREEEAAARNKKLDDLIKELDEIRAQTNSKKARKEEATKPWAEFVRTMRLLSSQSWGPRVEKYFIKFYGWEKVPASENRGDAKTPAGEYVEIKTTMLTKTNTGTNFVQIRPYQKIEGYRMFVVDTDYKVWRFDLTKEQMASEIIASGQSAHGTASSSEENTNREYAIRFSWNDDDPTLKRWKQNYHVQSNKSNPTPDQQQDGLYQKQSELK